MFILACSFLVLCVAEEFTGFILHRGTEFLPKQSLTQTHLSFRYHGPATYRVGTAVAPDPENMKWRPSGDLDNVSLCS